MKKIVIYGIGRGSDYIESILSQDCEIVAYTDSFASISLYKNMPFVKPERLNCIWWDYIVIAITDREKAIIVLNELVGTWKIEKERIIPFFCVASREKYKHILGSTEDLIEGIIIGNSMSMYGIAEELFKQKAVNLSAPSQDIYDTVKILEKSILDYSNKFDLKFLIMDLYDYNGFNFDISQSRRFFDYIEWGGIINKHNFDKNKHFDVDFEQALYNEKRLILDLNYREIVKLLFREDYNPLYLPQKKDYSYIKADSPLITSKCLGGNVKKVYPETISENVTLLRGIIEKYRVMFPELRIVLTLVPRFHTMEAVTRPFMEHWKNEMYGIMKQLKMDYEIDFMDYKECKEISENYYFFKDVNHLNVMGSYALTSKLIKDLNL